MKVEVEVEVVVVVSVVGTAQLLDGPTGGSFATSP